MASIYESAQNNYLRAQGGGRITQSQHDAARRYANANNMDYDPNKGYGAKGSFDTQKIPTAKVRDPRRGEFKGGAMGFAGIGAALGLDKMTPSQAQAEMTKRFGGGPSQLPDGTPNPYKRYDNVPEEIRQMQIRRYEEGPETTIRNAEGEILSQGKLNQIRNAYNTTLADRQTTLANRQAQLTANSLMGSVKPRSTSSVGRISSYSPAKNTSFLLDPSITLMGQGSQPNKSRLDIQRDALQNSFNGITI